MAGVCTEIKRSLCANDKSSLEDYIEAVAATQKTILLNFTKYKLEFGQQGQVNLQIEYVGSLDSLIADPEASDVFSRVEVQPENRNIIVPRALQYSKGFVYGYNADGLVSDTAFGFQEGVTPSPQAQASLTLAD